MGYTAAFEPAMIFSNARQAHLEMGDVPILDHGAYVMLGNDEIFGNASEKKGHSLIRDYVGWSINASKAMGVKVVILEEFPLSSLINDLLIWMKNIVTGA